MDVEQHRQRLLRFECRACGAEPEHSEPGTWGGLIPIEQMTGYIWCKGESLVVLCILCFEIVRRELADVSEKTEMPVPLSRLAVPVTWLDGGGDAWTGYAHAATVKLQEGDINLYICDDGTNLLSTDEGVKWLHGHRTKSDLELTAMLAARAL